MQHRLRVHERAGATKDDVEIVEENSPNSDEEGLDDGTILHPKNLSVIGGIREGRVVIMGEITIIGTT